MPNETLEAVRKDFQVFTAIEQQLRDGLDSYTRGGSTLSNSVETVLQVIQQQKADLYAKYNI